MRRSNLVSAGLLLVLLAVPASKLHAQAVYGSITGSVLEMPGAAVPNAKVTITDVLKDDDSTASNESGHYSQTHLIIGNTKCVWKSRVLKQLFRKT